MASTPKNQPDHDSLALKLKRIAFLITRFIVGFSRQYLSPRIWVIVIALIILMFMNGLLTKYGLLMILVVIGYFLLIHLDKWLEEHEDN